MKICIISDTHNKHNYLGYLPEADVIIHCGDFTSMGYDHEIKNFMKWYSKLDQFQYKIIIAGNHDILFEKEGLYARSFIPDNVIYLEDSGIEINGTNFYGTPVTKPYGNWAFNRPEEKLEQYWKAIPDGTDVLITHNPPFMIGDYVKWLHSHEGSPSLYKEVVERIKPKLHCFGHIHQGFGKKIIEDTVFINASNLNENYECVNTPPYSMEIKKGDS
jgi:Icc-related predicted phosphoesterase